MTANLLDMRGITKIFPGCVANHDVNFSVQKGEIHGLLGENGAGKTTLMSILYGLYGRDAGEIHLRGRPVEIRSPHEAISLGIGMVHQEFMLVQPFTVAENVALGLRAGHGPLLAIDQVRAEICRISRRYGLAVDPDARIEHLSVGARQRAEIIKLLVRDVDLLIMDEPTAVLVPQEAEGLFSMLRALVADGRTIVLITHKLNEVMAITDRVSVLRDGRLLATKRTSNTTMSELACLMVGREVLFSTQRDQLEAGERALEVRDIHALSDKGTAALNGVSFTVHKGEILGVAGVDGNGQTELAELLTGLRHPRKGRVLLGERDVTSSSTARLHDMGLRYVPSDRRGVGSIGSFAISANTILGRLDKFGAYALFMDARKIKQHAETVVKEYDVRTPNIRVAARKLSGGNLQKLILGRELSPMPQVLIVEQPTRGLDVGAIEYVRGRLLQARKNGAAILLISTELEEILALSDRIIVLYEGRIMGTLCPEEVDVEMLGLMISGTPKDKVLADRSEAVASGQSGCQD